MHRVAAQYRRSQGENLMHSKNFSSPGRGRALSLAACALALMAAGSAHANLVYNGDFSLGNTGFTSGYGYVPYPNQVVNGQYTVGPLVPPSYFDWYPFMPPPGATMFMTVNGGPDPSYATIPFWEQSVTVTPGKTYQISFDLAEISSIGNDADVAVNDGSTYLADFAAPNVQDYWQSETLTYTPTTSSVDLQLIDLNTDGDENDFAVGNISLQAVPEPPAFLALGIGAAGLLIRRKRRTQR